MHGGRFNLLVINGFEKFIIGFFETTLLGQRLRQ